MIRKLSRLNIIRNKGSDIRDTVTLQIDRPLNDIIISAVGSTTFFHDSFKEFSTIKYVYRTSSELLRPLQA